MKIRLSNILFAALCIALLSASLCIGAVRGWSIERNEILSAMEGSGELRNQFEYRGMDAANLCVVAARHLPEEDADLIALRQASDVLLSTDADAHALLQADADITAIARTFAAILPDLPSVQASARDQMYISTLALALDSRNSLTLTYTEMINDFNQRLAGSPTGQLAMFFGVDPLPSAQD